MTLSLLLSCGEPSGDLYAGALTRQLRSLVPDIRVSGLGGPHLAAAGGQVLEDYRGLSVTGLTEAVAKVPRLLGTRRRLVSAARADRPAALVAVDYPDFNFSLARHIRRLGIPVVYYISPQVWAWRPGRLRTLRELADRVLVIFPFEEAMYREAGVPVTFVGHPLVDLIGLPVSRQAWLSGHGLNPEAPTAAVLPGSRTNEVVRILPDLMAAIDLMRVHIPSLQTVVARAPNLDDRLFEPARRRATGSVVVVNGETDGALASADVALTASGTATVQAALHDTPMVIVYRVSPLTYRLGRRLVRVDTFGMVNLIAEERLVPELIQEAFTPAAVAAEAVSLLTSPERAAAIRAGLARVRLRLGGGGASRRAAEAILTVMGRAG